MWSHCVEWEQWDCADLAWLMGSTWGSLIWLMSDSLLGHNMTLFSVGYFPNQPIMLHNKHDIWSRLSWHGPADWAWVLSDVYVNLGGCGPLPVPFLGLKHHFGQCQRSRRCQTHMGAFRVGPGCVLWWTTTACSPQPCVPSGLYPFNYHSRTDLFKHIFFCKMGHFYLSYHCVSFFIDF